MYRLDFYPYTALSLTEPGKNKIITNNKLAITFDFTFFLLKANFYGSDYYSIPLVIYFMNRATDWLNHMINRPGVARAVLQTPLSINNSLIISLRHSSIGEISSEYLHSKTLRAREQNFSEKVHLPPCVMYHMSHGKYHISYVTKKFKSFIQIFFVKLFNGGSVINGDTPSSFLV